MSRRRPVVVAGLTLALALPGAAFARQGSAGGGSGGNSGGGGSTTLVSQETLSPTWDSPTASHSHTCASPATCSDSAQAAGGATGAAALAGTADVSKPLSTTAAGDNVARASSSLSTTLRLPFDVSGVIYHIHAHVDRAVATHSNTGGSAGAASLVQATITCPAGVHCDPGFAGVSSSDTGTDVTAYVGVGWLGGALIKAGNFPLTVTLQTGAWVSSATSLGNCLPFTTLCPPLLGSYPDPYYVASADMDAHVTLGSVDAIYDLTPQAPKNLTATSGPGSVTVKWSPPISPAPVTGYVLDMLWQDPGSPLVTLPASQTSYTVSGLTSGQTYGFEVWAVDDFGRGISAYAGTTAG